MDIFSIDLTSREIALLRQSLDVITITGKDAMFVGNLQYKLEAELQNIQAIMAQQKAEEDLKQAQKAAELEKVLAAEARKQKKAELAANQNNL